MTRTSGSRVILVSALFTLLVEITPATKYKDVVFIHGILGGPYEADDFTQWLEKSHPGTKLTAINDYDALSSLWPMDAQVSGFEAKVKTLLSNPKGVHLICFSQGGLVCRGLLSKFPHNVDTFISLSSPQAGQYGDTSYLRYLFPQYVKKTIYKFFYSAEGQKWSVGNYWNDPHHQDLYLKYSAYLAILNNQTYNNNSQEYRTNFLHLKNLVLIGGPNDGVITPWQSSHFGFYDENEKIVEMRNQEWYKSDSFGLKTLDQRGSIHTYSVPGVAHINWHTNYTVFQNNILPWLT
ncbi:hypothetical protein ScPMuIL_011105 [Solemya velum]